MIAALALALAVVVEAPPGWVLLPARGEQPPPQDPTLLRLSAVIHDELKERLSKDVKLVDREVRDEACPSADGICAAHVTDLLHARAVVSLLLTPDQKQLQVRIYSNRGLEREGSLPCRWDQGSVTCELAGLVPLIEPKKKAPEIDPKVVDAAFGALKKKLLGCKKLGLGDTAKPEGTVTVQFRIDREGHAAEVRLEPLGLEDAPAYSCMARAIESLRFHRMQEPTERPYSYPLP
jgi:hypothetical protein